MRQRIISSAAGVPYDSPVVPSSVLCSIRASPSISFLYLPNCFLTCSGLQYVRRAASSTLMPCLTTNRAAKLTRWAGWTVLSKKLARSCGCLLILYLTSLLVQNSPDARQNQPADTPVDRL